jgi:hypothetical protein
MLVWSALPEPRRRRGSNQLATTLAIGRSGRGKRRGLTRPAQPVGPVMEGVGREEKEGESGVFGQRRPGGPSEDRRRTTGL